MIDEAVDRAAREPILAGSAPTPPWLPEKGGEKAKVSVGEKGKGGAPWLSQKQAVAQQLAVATEARDRKSRQLDALLDEGVSHGGFFSSKPASLSSRNRPGSAKAKQPAPAPPKPAGVPAGLAPAPAWNKPIDPPIKPPPPAPVARLPPGPEKAPKPPPSLPSGPSVNQPLSRGPPVSKPPSAAAAAGIPAKVTARAPEPKMAFTEKPPVKTAGLSSHAAAGMRSKEMARR